MQYDPFFTIKQEDLYALERSGKLVWDEFTDHQCTTLASLLKSLCEKLEIKDGNVIRYAISPTDIVGYSDVCVSTKKGVGPGPKFPWKYLADQGVGAWPDEQQVEAINRKLRTIRQVDIAWLQDNLRRYGYQVETTKIWDEQTRDAVRGFQTHFEPDNYSGLPNVKTVSILSALIKKYLSEDYTPHPVDCAMVVHQRSFFLSKTAPTTTDDSVIDNAPAPPFQFQ